ncbi:MAG TPA: hypothetical protein VFE62_24830 [Gemmataceae bacterium]|nr:hypothetical protein [Gemmataceae bacterium]
MRLLPLLALMIVASSVHAGDKKFPLLFEDDFAKGAERWQPTDAKAWKVVKTDKGAYYDQFQQSKYKTLHRSPFNFALIKDLRVTDFVLEAKALSTGKDNDHRDMCLFFGYQDPAHYYYVHMAKKSDDRANQIFIVNGADRVKISTKTSKGTPWDDQWHDVKVVRDTASGKIEIYWSDMKTPIMTATDKTFAWGQVGIGSFDDTGHWTDVKLHGTRFQK